MFPRPFGVGVLKLPNFLKGIGRRFDFRNPLKTLSHNIKRSYRFLLDKNFTVEFKKFFFSRALVLVVIALIIFQLMPAISDAANTFSASFNSSSLNADSAIGSSSASNDGTAATLGDGYGLTGQAAQISTGQTLKYATNGNLATDKGRISLQAKLNNAFNGDNDTGRFNAPYGIAYDASSDYVFIADTSNHRIIKTKIDGTGWTTYGTLGSGTGNFNTPTSISYDSSTGFIYVTDTSNHRIVKTKIDGTGWATYGSSGSGVGKFNSPYSVQYVGATSMLYIADSSNNRIVKTQFDGTGWTTYGTSGTGAGNFSTPRALYYDASSDYCYVQDTNNERIVKTKIDGTGWATYGSSGSGTGQFSADNSYGIWYDSSSEYIYVSDSGNYRLVKTKIDGTGWTTFGSNGSGTNNFSLQNKIFLDSSSGYFYIADSSNNRIVKTKFDGTGWTVYGSNAGFRGDALRSPYDLEYDETTGYIYVADYASHRLIRTKPDGTGWSSLGGLGNQSFRFNQPTGLSLDRSTGYVYIADKTNNRIVKTKIDGTGWVSLGGFSSPTDVAYDASTGYMYVTDTSNNRIVKTKINGYGWSTYGSYGQAAGRFNAPYGIQYDSSSQYLYVTDYTNQRIVKTKFDGTGWTTLGGSYITSTTLQAGKFYNPYNLSYDPVSDYIYVCDTSTSRVIKTKIDGTGWTTISHGNGANPQGVHYNSTTGNIYFSDTANYQIQIISAADYRMVGTVTSGSKALQLSNPMGVFYDSVNDYYYIVDAGNNRIVKTKLDGSNWSSYGGYCASTCTQAGQFYSPTDVYYDQANDYLYVLEGGTTYGSKIIKTRMDGSVWSSYGTYSTTSGTGKFYAPYGFDYDPASGYFYVINAINATGRPALVKTQFDGTGWTNYGNYGTGSAQFSTPQDIDYDPASDYIYIADTNNERIVKTKIDGTGWTTYGTSGAGIGNFGADSPKGISYDAAGDYVYVGDSVNNRAVRTKIDGSGWRTFGVTGKLDGMLSTPGKTTLDITNGKLILSDYGNNRVVRYDLGGDWTSYGTSGSGSGNFSTPSGTYYDSSGSNVYIADTGNNRIVKTQIDGTGWTAYGTNGSGQGNFSAPRGIYYDQPNDYIYVLDSGNSRIVKTKIDGTGWTTFGSSGSGANQFSGPNGFWYDASSQYFYIADTGNNRVVKTKFDGTGWTTYGTQGSGINQFNAPYGIYYDSSSEYFFVADYTNYRIVRAKIDGAGWKQFGTYHANCTTMGAYMCQPQGIGYDSTSGMLYATSASRLTKFNMDYTFFTTVSTGTAGSGIEQFSTPRGLYVDSSSGNVYVADGGNNRIVKVDVAGDNWANIGQTYLSQPVNIGNAYGNYYDAQNDTIYIADTANHRIVKYKMDGSSWSYLGGPTFGQATTGTDPVHSAVGYFNSPYAVYYDAASEYIYVADGTNNRIVKTKMDGSGWTVLGGAGTGVGQLTIPKGVWYDAASEYLYITDNNNERIVKTKIDGTGWTAYGSLGSGTGQFSSNGATGITYDASTGFIYVADTGNNRIVKTKIDGTGWTAYGTSGSGVGNFSAPSTVSYDSSTEMLYISDYSNNRIVKTKIDGAGWTSMAFTSAIGITYAPSNGLTYVSDYSGGRVVRLKFDGVTIPATSMSRLVFFQSQGDGMRLEANPLNGQFRFYPAYGVDRDKFVASEGLNFDANAWHEVIAWYNQADGQLKLSVDGTEFTASTSWSLPSYGDNFYVGSNTGGTESINGSIDEFKILDVYEDNDTPTNPTSVHGYSATNKSIELIDEHWYTYNTTGPYFEWTGAADIGSGISGYWVYFGTNSNANAITQGTFQTGASYQNTATLTTGQTYYLRVSAKDNSNHTALTSTLFTYNYDQDPPGSPSVITISPLGCTTSEPFTMSWTGATGGNSGISGYEYKNGPEGQVQTTTESSAQVSHYQDNANVFYVRTKNNAGSVSNWQTTTYCYATDSGPPTNPTTIEAKNQSGGSISLTSGNWYNYSSPYFTWGDATDDTGVAGYYVYFGISNQADPATDGVYQTGRNLAATASTSGQNYYLRIKAKDLAGNVAATSWEAFTYKYSTESPVNPTDLSVVSASGSQTALSSATWYNYQHPYFEWSGAGGGQGVLGYYVYFGTLESADPLTDGSFQAGNTYSPTIMESGSTYYLKIKSKDNAGNPANASWSPFNYKFDSSPPDLPEYIDVEPKSCSTSNNFTLSWDDVNDSQSGLDGYEYKKGSTGSVVPTADRSISVGAYQEGDNVFYARSKDKAGNVSSWQTGVFCSTATSFIEDGPSLSTGPSSITVQWVSSKATTGFVEVRQGNAYREPQGHRDYKKSHEITLSGLKPETDYEYKIYWQDESKNEAESEWYPVKTAETARISDIKSEIITPDSVLISWTTNYDASSLIKYGVGNYNKSETISGTGKSFSYKLTGLLPGENYQVAVDETATDGTIFSGGVTFTTPPPPQIGTLKFETLANKDTITVRIDWSTNVETTSGILYGPKDGEKKQLSTNARSKEHSFEVANLSDSTVYEVVAEGVDQYGASTKSIAQSFTTPADSRPPRISEISTDTSNVGLNKQDKAQIAVSWKTDEPAASYVEYSEGLSGTEYVNKTTEDKNFANTRLIIISDLDPNTPYHLRVVSSDKSGNVSKSEDISVIPGEVPKSVLQMLLNTFKDVFGWLNFIP